MRKVTKRWTCKDGRKIRICDMTDAHLQNTIAMLERNAPRIRESTIAAAYSLASMLQGEMASYYADQDIDRLEETPEEDFLHPLYDDLISERDRRKKLANSPLIK